MAKRKGAQQKKPRTPSTKEWATMIPRVREHFSNEIAQLLADIPTELWDNPEICGLLYDFLPWHEHSLVSIQLRDDDPTDIGGWEHYEPVTPDGRQLTEEFALYQEANDNMVYHRLLIEAAEALLGIDFTQFGQREAIEDGCLNRQFKLQIYHHDGKFLFNYCEYVLARRLEHK